MFVFEEDVLMLIRGYVLQGENVWKKIKFL